MTNVNSQLSRVARLLIVALFGISLSATALAQTTSFTYQGRLTDGGTAANGNYDLQFGLWDSASGGSQIGSAQTSPAVQISAGIFTVTLDFGANAFPGANRFLEISMRQTGGSAFTLLTPRQQITPTPYAIRSAATLTADQLSAACAGCVPDAQISSLSGSKIIGPVANAANATTATNALQLGGLAANRYVETNDPRLSDPRPPAAGSSSYIQNNAKSQQAGANFNIGGNGAVGGTLSANLINATSKFQINGNDVLSVTGAGTFVNSNTFAGVGAGESNTPSGTSQLGNSNAFFGSGAGTANTTGSVNSFFGAAAGIANTTGGLNSFFGDFAGAANTVGAQNTLVGFSAGVGNTKGLNNTFVGETSGVTNTTGNSNTVIGSNADVDTGNLTNATAIGANAIVATSNSLVLGNNANVGIGTNSPLAKLHIAVNSGNILAGDAGCNAGFTAIGFGTSLSGCTNYVLAGNGIDTLINRIAGGTLYFKEANVIQMQIVSGGGVIVSKTLAVDTLGTAGNTSLCINASNQISTCSSSLRYKKDLQPFTRGLAVLNSLKPITFRWKADNTPDLGFGAEDVAKVEPLLVTRNQNGEVEGVKYDRITAVLVNAVKEQQQQIQQQQEQMVQQQEVNQALKRQLARQQTEIDGFKPLLRGRHAKGSKYRER